MSGGRARWAPLALATLLVLIPTLTPMYGVDGAGSASLCLWCDPRALADVLSNVLLFVPFGGALALLGVAPRRAVLWGALLSLGVEAAQFAVVPGRDANPYDVLVNAAGAGLGGAALHLFLRRRLPEEREAARLSLAGAALALLVLAGGAYLLTPHLPLESAYVEWVEHSNRDVERYGGVVSESRLGPLSLSPGPLRRPDSVRALLHAGAPLEIRGRAGPPPARLAQLFDLTDPRHGEILFVGPDGDGLLLRYRARSVGLRLDRPAILVPHALRGLAPGAPLRLRVWREGRGYCVAVGEAARCGLGYTVGMGWASLVFLDSSPPALHRLLSVAWLAALALPVGFWLRRRRESALAVALLLLALLAVPAWASLLPTPPHEWLGAALGVLAGVAARHAAGRRAPGCAPAGRRRMVLPPTSDQGTR